MDDLNIKLYVMPGWIYRSLVRNKLNTVDISNYKMVRSVLSVDDMTDWFSTNDFLLLDQERISTEYLTNNFISISNEELSEISKSCVPLSGNNTVLDNIKSRLADSIISNEYTYKFIVSQNAIYLILNEGFIKEMQVPEKKLNFIRAYLKHCYAMAPIHKVSSLSVYRSYMSTLQKIATLSV